MITAAAAKKRQATEPISPGSEAREPSNGLWIDQALLPTSLAKKGSPRDITDNEWPAAGAESKSRSRLLRLAELVLGGADDTAITERRRKQRKFKGLERRLTG
jgi:hypothetical protein